MQKGIELFESRRYSEAATELREVVKEQPADATAKYYLGLALLELKEYEPAAEQFRLADEQRREIKPRADQIKAGLAQVYTEQKRYDEAQRLIDEALKENDKSAEAHFAQGKLRVHTKDYAAAVPALEKAIELDPANAYAHYNAGIAYSNMRRPDRMVNEFQIFLKLAPDAPEADKVKSLLRSVR
ncbi:MAG: tetratricopeptide repeat protein [Bryobacteraceae bacterium]